MIFGCMGIDGFESSFCLSLTPEPWLNYLTSLNLSFLICKLKKIMIVTLQSFCEDRGDNVKHLANCLIYDRHSVIAFIIVINNNIEEILKNELLLKLAPKLSN